MFSDLPCGSYIHFFFVFSPFTKEKNAERFKRSEHFLPAVTADCPDVGKTRQVARQFAPAADRRFKLPQKRSTIPPRAQRNAFRRRGARPQSRSFALRNQGLKRSQDRLLVPDIEPWPEVQDASGAGALTNEFVTTYAAQCHLTIGNRCGV
jgi:hypothetical protein